MTKQITKQKNSRWGMVIDLDSCYGCGACMVACSVENNVPPPAPNANARNGVTPLRVLEARSGQPWPDAGVAYFPVMCQQCGHHAPCVSVCPQLAVDVDPTTGVVSQIGERCLGCRYCMVACPYHARYFNWSDPQWPAGTEQALNPAVAPRMRGVVEKCTFCHGRYQTAQSKAAAAGSANVDPVDYMPACAEACPTSAIQFGDLADPTSSMAKAAAGADAFRLLTSLGTEPGVYYRTTRKWVREMAASNALTKGNQTHG